MKIAIYGKPYVNDLNQSIQILLDAIRRHGFSPVIYERFYDFLEDGAFIEQGIDTFNRENVRISEFDCLVSVGGDGTLLDTATLIADSKVPIIGINAGRLGFISSASIDEFEGVLKTLKDKSYKYEERALLQINTKRNLFGDLNFALNEVTVHKKDTAAMVKIEVELDHEYLNTYWADGLIVSTPTGSTAYNLSCGGPIVIPGSANMVVTPIAPHNLSVRPVVISQDSHLKLSITGRSENFLLALDSRSEVIFPGEEIEITKAPFALRLIQPEGHSFVNTMRHKLGWGLDKRN